MQRAEFLRVLKRSLGRALLALCAAVLWVAACAAYARFVEPYWLRVRRLAISDAPTARLVHISDIHFAGDAQYLQKVVDAINGTEADFVCFTGDLVEEAAFAKEALRILSGIRKPMYGVPGNHDRWALRSFAEIRDMFQKTGGEWLEDKAVVLPSKRLVLMTLASVNERTPPGYKRILLEHDPDATQSIHGHRLDLILAGHTHGGQVRIPLVRDFLLPFDVGRYDKGLFQTPCGPLYVNPGIGTYFLEMRFLCRPEVTVIDI